MMPTIGKSRKKTKDKVGGNLHEKFRKINKAKAKGNVKYSTLFKM